MDVGDAPEPLPGPLREPHALHLRVRDQREPPPHQTVPGREHRVGRRRARSPATTPAGTTPRASAAGSAPPRRGTVTPGSTRSTTPSGDLARARPARGRSSTSRPRPAPRAPSRAAATAAAPRSVRSAPAPAAPSRASRSSRPWSMRRPSGDSPTVQSYSLDEAAHAARAGAAPQQRDGRRRGPSTGCGWRATAAAARRPRRASIAQGRAGQHQGDGEDAGRHVQHLLGRCLADLARGLGREPGGAGEQLGAQRRGPRARRG